MSNDLQLSNEEIQMIEKRREKAKREELERLHEQYMKERDEIVDNPREFLCSD